MKGIAVDSYRFWDVVALWSRELLEHEVVVSRKLAAGVIKNGLKFESADPEWMDASEKFLGYPYIGYTVIEEERPTIIKAEVLAHLIQVAEGRAEPSKQMLYDEVVTRRDFKQWLVRTGQSFPEFWF